MASGKEVTYDQYFLETGSTTYTVRSHRLDHHLNCIGCSVIIREMFRRIMNYTHTHTQIDFGFYYTLSWLTLKGKHSHYTCSIDAMQHCFIMLLSKFKIWWLSLADIGSIMSESNMTKY